MFNNFKNVNAMKRIFKIITKTISPHLMVIASVFVTGSMMAQATLQINPKMGAIATPESDRNWINFKEGTLINPQTIFNDLREAFDLSASDQMQLLKTQSDEIGFTHYRYQQF